MKRQNNTVFIVLMLFLFGCVEQKFASHTKNADSSIHLYNRIPKRIQYDTLSGVFFYENMIQSYESLDAIVKTSGFIKGDTISEITYKEGYYTVGWYYVRYMKSKGIDINYDKKSISAFYDSLSKKSIKDGTYMDKTNINPYCGAYYKKFKMKIEVLYIDTVSQRAPLFLSCDNYEKFVISNNRKNYIIMPLPTYIITRIFSWNEL